MKNYLYDALEHLNSSKFIYSVLGIFLLLGLWQIGSIFMHEVMLASPVQTFNELCNMLQTELFWTACWVTAKRAFIGILLGGIAGFIFGIIAGLNQNIKNLLEPMRWMVMSISPIIVVGIAMMWFGIATQMVVFIAAFLLSPIVYVNTIKGMEMVDNRIIDMANVYKFSIFQKLIHVYIPALIGPLAAAMTIVITSGMRIIILAEVLGANSGIGYEFSFANSDMNTPQIFAWLIVTLAFVGIVEYLFFKPIENYFLRWKE